MHEIGRGIENTALTDADLAVINKAYSDRVLFSDTHPNDPEQRADDCRGCYALGRVAEFCSQLSASYPGTNLGYDRTTYDRRHNGKEWVLAQDERVHAIL